jgi:hypothetical protein
MHAAMLQGPTCKHYMHLRGNSWVWVLIQAAPELYHAARESAAMHTGCVCVHPAQVRQDELEQILREVDTDGSGQVDFDEFLQVR